MNIGFVGLGRMGRAIARNLIGAGHALALYNRTRSKAEELAREAGDGGSARVASTPAEAARGAEVVITMLADDAAVDEVVLGKDGIASALERGRVHVSMSTIGTATARRLARAHGEAGQAYVAAPVLGRPEAAEKAQLVVVAAGAPDALARCKPIFDAVGKETHLVGDAPESANALKLGANFLLATMIEALGEAYALVEPFGVDARAFLSIVNGGMLKSPVVEGYGARIADRAFEPAGFALRLGLKDVRLALEAGESVAVPMPIASVLRDRFIAAIAQGLEEADWSAVARPTPPTPRASKPASAPRANGSHAASSSKGR